MPYIPYALCGARMRAIGLLDPVPPTDICAGERGACGSAWVIGSAAVRTLQALASRLSLPAFNACPAGGALSQTDSCPGDSGELVVCIFA